MGSIKSPDGYQEVVERIGPLFTYLKKHLNDTQIFQKKDFLGYTETLVFYKKDTDFEKILDKIECALSDKPFVVKGMQKGEHTFIHIETISSDFDELLYGKGNLEVQNKSLLNYDLLP